jgi:hypothetical protein
MRVKIQEIQISLNRDEAFALRRQINLLATKAKKTICMHKEFEDLYEFDLLLSGNFDSTHEGIHRISKKP